jgi:hypothetical protein
MISLEGDEAWGKGNIPGKRLESLILNIKAKRGK